MLRLDLAGEFLEHEMLVLHLGAELRRLEQALAVPLQRVRSAARRRPASTALTHRRSAQPLVEEGEVACVGEHDVLGVLDQPVVLGVEHVVDGGQADVLVDAAVAGDEVRVEQLVVVVAVGQPLPGLARPISMSPSASLPIGTAVWAMSARKAWLVRSGAESASARSGPPRLPTMTSVVGRVRDAVGADAGDQLREAVRRRDEVAIGIGREQRHAADIEVGRAGCRACSRPAP